MPITATRVLHGSVLAAVFGAGILVGSLTQRTAEAQLGELGGKALEAAGQQGGTLGSAAKLGTSITEMQEHVSGLQKNLETLKQIQAALGG